MTTRTPARETKRENYTLFLCKFDPNRAGDPKFIGLIGRVVRNERGYRFLPSNAARKPSRKFHDSCLKAIPPWTERMGFLCLLDGAEFRVASGVSQ